MATPSRSSKTKEQRAPRYCYAEGCGLALLDGLFMCGNHWALLPDDLKMALADAYVLGQDDDENLVTMIWLDAAMRCITYVAARERRQGK
jgi:hypothetical protein